MTDWDHDFILDATVVVRTYGYQVGPLFISLDLTVTELIDRMEELAPLGYRIISISAYGPVAEARFAVIWRQFAPAQAVGWSLVITHSIVDRAKALFQAQKFDPYYPGPDISAIEQTPQGGDVYVPSGYWVNYLIETAPGHWVASAVDALRMVSGIEAGALLTPSSRDLLWKEKFSDKGGGGVMKAGWFWLDGEKGRTIAQHNGAIKGVNALVMRRSDGISIALLINKDLPAGPSPKGGWRGAGLHAPVQGKELYAIVDAVMAGTEWPAASLDIFPEAGLDPLA